MNRTGTSTVTVRTKASTRCPAAHAEQRRAQPPGPLQGQADAGRVHASTARPFSANRPCGRFWMKAMISTRMKILVSTAPMYGSEQLHRHTQAHRRVDRAGELPDAAQHHDHEGIDDVALPQVRTDVADLRKRNAGQPGDSRTQAEGEQVHAAGGNAHARRHRPVLRDRANEQSQARAREHQPHRHQHDKREADDDDAVVRQSQVGELDAARHPRRVGHFHVLRAEDLAHELDQEQADAPGRQQRLQRPPVQPADHGALQRHAHQRGGQERHRHSERRIPIDQPRRIALDDLLRDVGGIGADHDHLAVRHVDDAEQAIGDGQPQRGQQQDAAEADAGEQAPGVVAHRQALVDRLDRDLRRLAHLGVRLGVRATAVLLQQREQQLLGPLDVALAQHLHRGHAHLRIGALEVDAGLESAPARP